MYVVTWEFQGTKQSQRYASLAGAERRETELKRLGCRKVKVRDENKPLDKPKSVTDIKNAWAAVDASVPKQQNESETDMSVNVEGAHERAQELWDKRYSKSEIVAKLNAEFEPTFFKTTSGIYAVNEPDYLPEVLVLACKGRDE